MQTCVNGYLCVFIKPKNTKHTNTRIHTARATTLLATGARQTTLSLWSSSPTDTLLNVHAAPCFFDFGIGSARYRRIGPLLVKSQDSSNIPMCYVAYAYDFCACLYFCFFSPGFLPRLLKRCLEHRFNTMLKPNFGSTCFTNCTETYIRISINKQICAMDPMMPLMLAEAAGIIGIIGIPFLPWRPAGALLIFYAMLATPTSVCKFARAEGL